MSKKHFDEYYKTVCNQYSEMLEALHEVEELTMQQMIGPDRLDNIKRQIEPLKNNYMTLSYVAFLQSSLYSKPLTNCHTGIYP